MQEGDEQTLLPAEAKIFLPVCYCQCTLLCCSLLGKHHRSQRHQQTIQTDQTGWLRDWFDWIDCKLHTMKAVVERRAIQRITLTTLHLLVDRQQSSSSDRRIQLCYHRDSYRNSLLRSAISLFNTSISLRLSPLIL